MSANTTPAYRGDLILVESTHGYYFSNYERQEHKSYELGIVKSVTRDGIIKAYEQKCGNGRILQQVKHQARSNFYHIIPCLKIDTKECWNALGKEQWDSAESAKAAILQFAFAKEAA